MKRKPGCPSGMPTTFGAMQGYSDASTDGDLPEHQRRKHLLVAAIRCRLGGSQTFAFSTAQHGVGRTAGHEGGK
jgi:hypothetical protein